MVTPVQRSRLRVEVVCVAEGRNFRKEMLVPAGRTVGWCVNASGVRVMFPDLPVGKVGVWGRVVEPDVPVCEGDRVEVYVKCDPSAGERARKLRKSVAPGAKAADKDGFTRSGS